MTPSKPPSTAASHGCQGNEPKANTSLVLTIFKNFIDLTIYTGNMQVSSVTSRVHHKENHFHKSWLGLRAPSHCNSCHSSLPAKQPPEITIATWAQSQQLVCLSRERRGRSPCYLSSLFIWCCPDSNYKQTNNTLMMLLSLHNVLGSPYPLLYLMTYI